MIQTSLRRPPAPSPAERAKTIATRGGPASLAPRALPEGERFTPLMHHVHASGDVSVLLPDWHQLSAATLENGRTEITVMCELTDQAPIELREPVRGLLWITGRLRTLDDRDGRARAVSIADANPDPRLLDVGHGAGMLALRASSFVLADAEGTHAIPAQTFGSATPDPFASYEQVWLRHLESEHRDVLEQLARHLPPALRGGRIRPLGLDRYGLRLRVEQDAGDHDVRLAFSTMAHSRGQLAAELRRLLGCPLHAEAKKVT